MKRYAFISFLTLLASCSTAPNLTIEQQTVEAFVKASTNDPSSYEGVHWGKSEAYSRKDSAVAAAESLTQRYNATAATSDAHRRAQLINQAVKLEAITDTARIATAFTHAYRAKNKLGALVLDSARFVVYPSGKVIRL